MSRQTIQDCNLNVQQLVHDLLYVPCNTCPTRAVGGIYFIFKFYLKAEKVQITTAIDTSSSSLCYDNDYLH